MSGQQPYGIGGGLFIAPIAKEPVEESSTEQVRWASLEADEKALEAGLKPD
jgi:hypothetical protein